jgi:hypothetical protein
MVRVRSLLIRFGTPPPPPPAATGRQRTFFPINVWQ